MRGERHDLEAERPEALQGRLTEAVRLRAVERRLRSLRLMNRVGLRWVLIPGLIIAVVLLPISSMTWSLRNTIAWMAAAGGVISVVWQSIKRLRERISRLESERDEIRMEAAARQGEFDQIR